ncbi:MAG: sodium:solute symporter family protein [Synergistaceae bacterium]|jgi:SSS family solute:Na+ symporter|nr:sodium:solute symporter family protein [Synergistaceae bacterium]
MNMTILVVVLAVYFLGMIGIGWFGKKNYGKDFNTMISAGRNVGVILFIGTSVGTHIGNGFVVGGSADGAANGISGIWYGIACAVSYLILAFTVSKAIFKQGYITLPEFLRARYGDKVTSVIFVVATVIANIGNIGVQIMAGKALFSALGLNGNLGAVIIAVVVLIYSSLSGLWGAFATSVVQVAVIIAGLITTSAIIMLNGGISVITEAFSSGATPKTYFDVLPGGIMPVLSMLIPITLAVAADQCTVQRINSSKSEKVAFWGFILSFLIMVPLAFMPAFVGMYGYTFFGEKALGGSGVFFSVAMHSLGPWLSAILIAAVIAAIMSTIDALTVANSTVVVNDLYRGMVNPEASEKALLLGDRIVTVIGTGAALMVALSATNIINLLVSVNSFVAACVFASFIGCLYWKGGTRMGSIASAIAGFLAVVIDLAGIVRLPYNTITPILISIAAYIVVSLFTKDSGAAAGGQSA